MSLETKLKASEGKFAVCIKDVYPKARGDMATMIEDGFGYKDDALSYAAKITEEDKTGRATESEQQKALRYMAGGSGFIEPVYFVINDQGLRIY